MIFLEGNCTHIFWIAWQLVYNEPTNAKISPVMLNWKRGKIWSQNVHISFSPRPRQNAIIYIYMPYFIQQPVLYFQTKSLMEQILRSRIKKTAQQDWYGNMLKKRGIKMLFQTPWREYFYRFNYSMMKMFLSTCSMNWKKCWNFYINEIGKSECLLNLKYS